MNSYDHNKLNFVHACAQQGGRFPILLIGWWLLSCVFECNSTLTGKMSTTNEKRQKNSTVSSILWVSQSCDHIFYLFSHDFNHQPFEGQKNDYKFIVSIIDDT